MISGPVKDPEYNRVLQVNSIYDWGALENDDLQQCGFRVRQVTDKSFIWDQEAHAREVGLVGRSTRRHHMFECLTDEHSRVAKRGELNWLATQSMVPLRVPFKSHRHFDSGYWTKRQRHGVGIDTGKL